ncbi:hypothetical protein PNEG_02407 [Pneumocystis murina B123]|uniref:glucan endo-1,3-beta-D-glucosidase n=2 Tax=Pneumocystis murina TaxID=263815 RepID=M7P6G5_PNEMU|nr:hypothetical protein PNEG_02407 [Pneumocystis murina B123]AIU47330.1 endo-beta-1,3-glucanase [Pneumocystis murina]AIU47331.1 endo-beta-1,3-glucanase [Pneumocystis murina]EMR09465.1 hypothetical protein PNEG_02407 [Pneumocystis murina B123]
MKLPYTFFIHQNHLHLCIIMVFFISYIWSIPIMGYPNLSLSNTRTPRFSGIPSLGFMSRIFDFLKGIIKYFGKGYNKDDTNTTSSNTTKIDVLTPITTREPLSLFKSMNSTLSPLSIHENDLKKPIHTNKFYSNFYLGTQRFPSFLDPYVLTWNYGVYSGIAVAHSDDNQKVFGEGTPPKYFFNPLGVYSATFTAKELENASLTLTSLDQMSVNVIVNPSNCTEKKIEMPLVRGMAYVTGIYTDLTPIFTSVVGFRNIEKKQIDDYYKFKATLHDGKKWLLYVFPKEKSEFNFEIEGVTLKATNGTFNGFIQLAKIPIDNDDAESILDASAGTYATKILLSASVSGNTGSYTFRFETHDYKNNSLLHFAMPHHIVSFDSDTASRKTNLSLPSPTNGLMVAYTGKYWNMLENDLPVNINFFPYSPSAKKPSYSKEALEMIRKAAIDEIAQDFCLQIDPNSYYFSGKVLSKFALLCFSIKNILKNDTLAEECLTKLKDCFMPFVKNSRTYKLVYEKTWFGIVTEQGFVKDKLSDFGASFYNDHHFHYGYLIFTAAIIGYLDKKWIEENKDWVIDLIRDVANPVNDSYFPAFRYFDWFAGHSWSKGLFESGDGKDEESSSEDYNFYFAVKLFGHSINDTVIISRSNLMLAVMKRSLLTYFLYEPSNTVMPKAFLSNYVAGIKFMNKIDHSTYFSPRPECIQGIHMLPLTPISPYIRIPSFVRSEWDNKLASIVDTIEDGWKSILYANLAIIDPKKSYEFFSMNFDKKFLDIGSSLTWYLVYSSAFANSK